MPLNPLNHHYAMENPASVYDEEALTALELAGRTTAKVNETVQAFNKLEGETNAHLDNQDETIATRLGNQDETIATRLGNQDTAIKKMNDVTMPAKVKTEFQNNLDNGTFEGMVDTYAGNLEARVDNLLGAVSEGSTTGDAELIDIRTGTDNHNHTNAGQAVRSQVDNLKASIESKPGLYRKNLLTSITYGKYYSTSGGFSEMSRGSYSNPIYLNKGETVYLGWKSTYGSNNKMFLVTKDGTYIAHYDLVSVDETNLYAVATAPRDGYYAFNLPENTINYHAHVAIAYNLEDLFDERIGVHLPEVLNPDVILNHLPVEIKRPNLVTGVYPGYYAGDVLVEDNDRFFHTNPIFLRVGETVYTNNRRLSFGGNDAAKMYGEDMETIVQVFTADEVTDSYTKFVIKKDGWYTFNDDGNICVCKNLEDLGAPMGAFLPEDVIYPDTTIFGNPLTGKAIVFDGDSICHGTSVGSDDPTYGYGWAGRIGANNGMYWYNEGIGGGTITSELYHGDGKARHWVSSNIDTIADNHPDLDYLILEGGTNDADILGEEKLGTYTADNFTGTYDTTTFCGAVETLFYKAVTRLPYTKVGYIVAPKMGAWGGYTAELSIRRKFFETAIALCKKWGIPYIDLWDGSVLNPKLTAHYNKELDNAGNIEAGSLYTDGQHLTAKGYDRITPQIESWIKTL